MGSATPTAPTVTHRELKHPQLVYFEVSGTELEDVAQRLLFRAAADWLDENLDSRVVAFTPAWEDPDNPTHWTATLACEVCAPLSQE